MRVLATVETEGLVRQLREFERKVRKQVCKKAAEKAADAYVETAKANIPVRDTKQALKSAGIKIRFGKSKVKRMEGGASYKEYSDKKGRMVQISYKGGLLKKSQGKKLKSYRGEIAVAICGTRDGWKKRIGTRINAGHARGGDKRNVKRTRKLAKPGDAIYADPTKYAHLVNNGARGTKAYQFNEKGMRRANVVCVDVAYEETIRAAQEASRS